MNNKLSPAVLLLTLAAIILGGIAGYFLPDFMLSISFIGKLFLNSLKILAIPFVITLIIVGVASMGSKGKVKRSLGKTALYFVGTSLTASLVGVLLALGIQPGVGASKAGAFYPEEIIPHINNFSLNNLFGNFIPENFLSGSIEMQFFAAIVFAILLGTVLTTVDRKNRIVLDFFISLKEMLSGLMKYIFYIAPIGLFSLAGTLFAENWQNSDKLFSSLALFTVTIIFGLSFFALVVLPIVMRFFSNVSPYSYFSSLIPALSTAFATNSAVATLPITEECVKTTSIDERASSFMLPLGALFNSAGTALFLSASTIFLAQIYGLTISVGQILAIVGCSFFIASLTAFIPYASLFMLALVLDLVNFPPNVTLGVGLLVLVDFLFGRLRTVVDVWSDAVGVAVLGNSFDFKTARSAKAAIPAKRTFNKSNPKTTRSISTSKTVSPKNKRVSKNNTIAKQTTPPKNTKEAEKVEIFSKDTKSPFQISPEKNYLAETEKTVETKPNGKSSEKQSKPVVAKQSAKVAKQTQSVTKKDTPKKQEPVKKEQAPEKKQRPIIHKIEVPPLPVIPSFKEKQDELKIKQNELESKQTDADTAVTKASAILSQDTIERERAKIAAQLNLMREKETLKIRPQEEETQVATDKVEIENPQKTEDNPFTKIDFYSDDNSDSNSNSNDSSTLVSPEIKTEKAIEEPLSHSENVVAIEKQVSSSESTLVDEKISGNTAESSPTISTEEKKSVSYGRKLSKRTVVQKTTEPETESESNSEKPPTAVEKKEFAVETMSFGRGKKKK